MRFFRVFFWFGAVYHLCAAVFFVFLPWKVSDALGYTSLTHNFAPVFLIQVFGLFLAIGGLACAYVAEAPDKAVPLVSLLILFKLCLPALAYLALRRGELPVAVAWFHVFNDVIWLPFLAAFYFWFYHKPRPSRFLAFLDSLTSDFRN